mmetsp:Transcript_38370/g.91673  ORF Transcript_38370/g.91673 Transcript_38370/m.91673 type:complete len:333 (+) Transcript_38370:73-1071(+)
MAAGNSNNTAASAWQTFVIGTVYIVTSSTLISFNKFLMQPGRFSHAVHLTAIHMVVTLVLSLIFYQLAPQYYPSMSMARANLGQVAKWIAPLGFLFAVALYCSNEAYKFSSVAFLQFCKQGNVAIVFVGSCAVGLQSFSWTKAAVLCVVVTGCSICATGEIKFVMSGLLFQLFSQFAECSKNLIGEIVMTGAGLKLDVLTFVAFQAPFSLLPLLIGALMEWSPDVTKDFVAMWPVLLANAGLAFVLNVLIALTLKKLSALAFVLIGLLKDVTIVVCSAAVFGDPISHQQFVGFVVTLMGMGLWSHMKLQEQARPAEATPLVKEKADKVKESA